MRIPPEKIEEIRSSNDIIDVIAQHVRLKKRGKNFVGLCPFHQEKTPSFTVSPEKQVYHCFGCAKGGNVFTFVMEFEKVSFTEAVRSLAERAGITISYTDADQQQQSEIESLYSACRFAGLFFYNNLAKTDEGRGALEYFHDRGFSDETIRTFGLGYSLNAWDGLLGRAREEGIAREDLFKAGLIRTREDGSDYDYFRGRAMFPIFSASGRVVGFGARKLREDDPLGKYINSPETLIYNKSRILFGLFHAKDAIRSEETALMVEGYADLISLYQAGIRNVVASSGTALTEEHVQLISRYCKKLTLVYDADSAGSNATLRGLDVALAQDLDVAIVELPEGEDPDSFVRKFGGKEFLKLSEQAISFMEFKARQFRRSGAFSTPEGKAQAVRSIVQSIAKMKDGLKRTFYIKELSNKYDIYESELYGELEKWVGTGTSRVRADAPLIQHMPEQKGDTVPAGRVEIPQPEREILMSLLENQRDLISFILSNVHANDLADGRVRKLIEIGQRRFEETGSVDVNDLLLQIQDAELREILTEAILERHVLGSRMQQEKELSPANPREIAESALKAIQLASLKREFERKHRMQKDVRSGTPEALQLNLEIQDLVSRIHQLQADRADEPA
ncbi:MAG: DNA primase [Ignavibacteria bacterium]|nr:DNA primase [Ignavibacteria bacterium]